MRSLAGPVDHGVLHTVAGEITAGARRGKNAVTVLHEHHAGGEHFGFLLAVARGEQDVLAGNAVTYRQHGLEECGARVLAQAAHLARRGHVDTKHRVGLLQAVEGELRGLDAHIVEVEEALGGLLDGQTEHDACGQFDEVYLEHLAHEGEGT